MAAGPICELFYGILPTPAFYSGWRASRVPEWAFDCEDDRMVTRLGRTLGQAGGCVAQRRSP